MDLISLNNANKDGKDEKVEENANDDDDINEDNIAEESNNDKDENEADNEEEDDRRPGKTKSTTKKTKLEMTFRDVEDLIRLFNGEKYSVGR